MVCADFLESRFVRSFGRGLDQVSKGVPGGFSDPMGVHFAVVEKRIRELFWCDKYTVQIIL